MFVVAFGLLAGARETVPGVASAADSKAAGAEAAPHSSGRSLAVTFVSAPTFRPMRVSVETLNRMTKKLLADMAEHKIKAVGFVGEGQLGDYDNRVREARIDALRAWLDAGHELGSQTYRHMNLFDTPLEEWKENAVRGEALLNRLLAERGKKLRYFSYPYLNTGPDEATKKAAAEWLRERGYTFIPLPSTTWTGSSHRSIRKLSGATTRKRLTSVAAEYVPYMERMLEFYEGLSRDVFGREIPQVLMLTTSPLVADQFDELVAMLKRRGYTFVTLDEATKDEAYTQPETYTGEWGVSWLQRWAHTKLGAMRQEPYLPPYMRQYSKREGVPPAERKQD